MKFDLEVVDLETRVATFQLLQSLHNFFNPQNCYDCANNVENAPNIVTVLIDWIKFFFMPVLKLRQVFESRKCCHQITPN